MKKIKVLISIVLVFVVIVFAVKLIKKRKQELINEKTPPRPVYVVEATIPQKGFIEKKEVYLGYIKSVNEVDISSKTPAYIKKLYVDVGDNVKKGQLILALDDTQIVYQLNVLEEDIKNTKIEISSLKSKIEALKEDFEYRKRDYERIKKLVEKQATAKENLEKALVALKSSQANLENTQNKVKQLENKLDQLKEKQKLLKNELTYYKIYSPIDGKIQNIFLREGNLAVLGKPILKIEGNIYEVNINLPQDFVLDKNTKVYLVANNTKIPLKIDKFYSFSNKNLKVLRAILENKPKNITSNSYVNIQFTRKIRGTKIPVNAVLETTNGNFAFIYKNDKIEKIPITVLGQSENFVIVKENLPDMPIIIADESKLRKILFGSKVKIINEANKNET